MKFAFTEQQIHFRDAVRQVLNKECTPDDLRAAYDAPAARTARWATLAKMGVLGLTVPQSSGGLGLGLVDLIPILEEAGRAALPEPLLETTALAAPLLAAHPSDRSSAWLAGMAGGQVTAAVAPTHGVGPTTGGQALPAANGADLFILPTAHEPESAGPDIHAVPASAVTTDPVGSLDPTRRLANVGWTPSPNTLVASGRPARTAWSALADRAAVGVGAELLGLADRMITMTADYSKDRHQFGRPIGSFQAVKHLLAGARVKLEFARPTVYAAAWALDNLVVRPEAPRGVAGSGGCASLVPHPARSASLAKAYASDAALEAARVSLQVHGAIGYTWECDLHLYLKRTWALAESWGSAAEHRSRILSSLADDLNRPRS